MDYKENIKELIQKLIDLKEIALIYTDQEDTLKFSAGCINECSENEIIMHYIDPYGYDDGIAVVCIEDIFKIEYGSKYCRKLQILNNIRKGEIDSVEPGAENLFLSVLEYAMKTKKILDIEILSSKEEDAVGYVNSIEKGIVTIALITSYGEKDGCMSIKLDDITHVVCNSCDEKVLNILARNSAMPSAND